MNKKALLSIILAQLTSELENSQHAAHNAHLAATDDQSVAETQYDTLAIEASYLAEGQSRRVDEIKVSITLFEHLTKQGLDEPLKVSMGTLVQLEKDQPNNAWFFIGPAAGGFRCELENQKITLITPQSPMGSALMNKEEGDNVEIKLGDKVISDFIDKIR